MIFLIPCSQADIKILPDTIEAMAFFGGLQRHTVLFACAPTVQVEVAKHASKLKAVCANVTVDALPREPEGLGRYSAFNMIFRDAIELLYKREVKESWMWWEPDMTPIRAGWADRLELEYNQKGLPFMGVRRAAKEVVRGRGGEVLDEKDPNVQGDYMVAVGVYPPNFKQFSTMYKYPDPSGSMPTDVVIRHEVNRHLHHTNLIEHRYKTGNYRLNTEGKIECDDFEYTDGFPHYAGALSDMAFVVHGCKDGSLARLVLSNSPSVSVPQTLGTASTGQPDPQIAALKAENAGLRKDLEEMTQKWSQKENSYADEIEKLKEQLASKGGQSHIASTPERAMAGFAETLSIVESEPAKPVPSLDKIHMALVEAKKSVQLANLAADFGCNKAELRKLIETDPKIKIAPGGLAWVSLVAS